VCGRAFLVSPGMKVEVVRAAHGRGVPAVPGALSPGLGGSLVGSTPPERDRELAALAEPVREVTDRARAALERKTA
jgi:hypothetical protein